MMRAALYLRVSTAEQAERYSLPAQRRILVDYCKHQGWAYEVYEDAGISGETIDARPAMLRLLEDARARKFQVVLAIEMERFTRSRDGFDMAIIKRVFREAGIKFGTPHQLFDPEDVEDSFTSGLLALLASREKQKILVRTLRGKLEAARSGRYLSQAPFGYRQPGPRQGRLVVYEPEAEVVHLMFRLILEGASTRGLMRELERRGIPGPGGRKRWAHSTLCRLLTRPIYAGTAHYNRRERRDQVTGKYQEKLRPESEWIAISVPRIVPDDIFRRVQDRLKQNATFSKRNQKRFYLLKGLVKCGECGRAMVGNPRHGVAHYRCITRGDPRLGRCSTKTIRASVLESFVWDQVVRMLREPHVVLEEIRGWREGRVTERDEFEMRLASVQDALGKVPEERERVLTAYREGWATAEEAKQQLAGLDRKRSALDEERQVLNSRLGARTATEEQTDRLETLLRAIGDRLDHLSEARRFEVVHAFVERVILKADGTVWIHAFIPSSGNPTAGVDCAHYVKSR